MNQVLFDFSGSFFESEGLEDNLVKLIADSLKEFEIDSFLIGCSFPYSVSEDEKSLLKKELQFALVKKLEKILNKKPDFSNPTVTITIDFNSRKISFLIHSVFIEGNYNKFSREIAQTIFFCPSCRGKGCEKCNQKGSLGLETVEELIGTPCKKTFLAGGFSFHGAGREDVNVRMLGNGRKFILELKEPKKRSADLEKLEKTINKNADKKISVHSLAFSEQKQVAILKETRHFKKYGCIVDCETKISEKNLKELSGKELTILQQTPLRVIKRRSDLVRERKATILSVNQNSEKRFETVILAEAGLYIKEFVNSDSNRTNPSLSSLLDNVCACYQLDVLEIIENNNQVS